MNATDEQVKFIIDHLPQFDLTSDMIGEERAVKDFDTVEIGPYLFGVLVEIYHPLDDDGERYGKPDILVDIDEGVYFGEEFLDLSPAQKVKIIKEIEGCVEY